MTLPAVARMAALLVRTIALRAVAALPMMLRVEPEAVRSSGHKAAAAQPGLCWDAPGRQAKTCSGGPVAQNASRPQAYLAQS